MSAQLLAAVAFVSLGLVTIALRTRLGRWQHTISAMLGISRVSADDWNQLYLWTGLFMVFVGSILLLAEIVY